MCFVTLLVFTCVPMPWELRLDIGKPTIGTGTKVTCMVSRMKSVSFFMPLLGRVLIEMEVCREFC